MILQHRMRQFLCSFFLSAWVILLSVHLSFGWSGMYGVCSDCHTMHNSQDNLSMRFDGIAQPAPLLLRGDCVTCHTGINSIANTAATVGSNASSAASKNAPVNAVQGPGFMPRVMGDTEPDYYFGDKTGRNNSSLAGGSFWWVQANERFGHNVAEYYYGKPDGKYGNNPPGGGETLSRQLRCAGIDGCHGNRTIENPLKALEGGHHANTSSLRTNASVYGPGNDYLTGTSYRFLRGVRGIEDADWEFTASSVDHNIYTGTIRNDQSQAAASTTIDNFCASCHPDFHSTKTGNVNVGISGTDGFSSPWLRHPTDYSMPLTADYAGYSKYSTQTPVGRLWSQIDNEPSLVSTPGSRIITCLSCHRAHGTPYYAMLRWDYRGFPANSSANGCGNCHSSKK